MFSILSALKPIINGGKFITFGKFEDPHLLILAILELLQI